ncbi:hypothetical protein SAMN05444413_1283 [Roseivivax marinus]|nr:hypothetical protein SAMN05444413_1283 [Roseivivax marinus]
MTVSLLKPPRSTDGRRINHPNEHLLCIVRILARASAREALAKET